MRSPASVAAWTSGEPGVRTTVVDRVGPPPLVSVRFTSCHFSPATRRVTFATTYARGPAVTAGATLSTVTVVLTVVVPPSSSVTVSVTANTPLSPYVQLAVSVMSRGFTEGLGRGSGFGRLFR